MGDHCPPPRREPPRVEWVRRPPSTLIRIPCRVQVAGDGGGRRVGPDPRVRGAAPTREPRVGAVAVAVAGVAAVSLADNGRRRLGLGLRGGCRCGRSAGRARRGLRRGCGGERGAGRVGLGWRCAQDYHRPAALGERVDPPVGCLVVRGDVDVTGRHHHPSGGDGRARDVFLG